VAPCMPGASLTEVDGDTFTGSVKVKLGPISLLYKGSGEFLTKDEQSRTVVIKASGKDSRGNGTAAATVTVELKPSGQETVGSVVTDLSITGKPAQFGRGLISEVGGKILDSFATCLASKLAPAEEAPTPAENSSATETLPVTEEPPAAEELSTAEKSPAAQSASAKKPAVAEKPAEEPPKLSVVKDSPQEDPAVAAETLAASATGKLAGEAAAAHAPARAKPTLAPAPEPESEPIDLLAYAGPSVAKRAAPLIALIAVLVTFIALRRRRH
jgi:carbon monoxide dehydrogenase subunit G